MSAKFTAEQIMERMGFLPTDTGPYVSALREIIKRQVSKGMTNRSAGWSEAAYSMTAEERARGLLAWEWAAERGHYHSVRAIDGFSWGQLFPWVGDKLRAVGMHARIWRDKHILGLRNPYDGNTP